MDNWLESITDTKLCTDVRDSLVLSGGAITNMFLNIDVNDYDIYISDPKVLLRLVKYYTDHKDYNIKCEILDGTDSS